MLLVASTGVVTYQCSAATPDQFSSTLHAINSAFESVHNAQQKGGNVSLLVIELNEAISLYEKAQAENFSNPGQATAALLEATNFANEANQSSFPVAKEGAAQVNWRVTESVVAVIDIIVGTTLIFIYGDQLVRIIWLALYRNYEVRETDE